MQQASDTVSNNHATTQERSGVHVSQSQSILHSPPIENMEGRKDDQENVQVENLKDQTSSAAIVQSTSTLGDDSVIQIQSTTNSPAMENTKGRKNGQVTAQVENLDKQISSATIDQSTNTQGAIQEEAEIYVILSYKEVNHNDKTIKGVSTQTPEEVTTKSDSNPSQKKEDK